MSSFNMGGNGNSRNAESNQHLESLLDRLRHQSDPNSPSADSHMYQNYQKSGGQSQSYYDNHSGADSPRQHDAYDSAMDSPSFPPAAPTPPVQNFGQPSFPPSLSGAMRGGGDDRTNHLLNLLKFSTQGSSNQNHSTHQLSSLPAPREQHYSQAQVLPLQNVIHAPAPAAADPTGLLAALMKGSSHHESAKPQLPTEVPAPVSTWNAASPPSDTQQYLLNLLNRPKPSQNELSNSANASSQQATLTPPTKGARQEEVQEPLKEPPATDDHVGMTESVDDTPVQGHIPTRESFDFEPTNVESPPPKFGPSPQTARHAPTAAPAATSKASIFHYKNPFEDLAASSPLQRAPKTSTTPGGSGSGAATSQHTGPIQILKKSDQHLNRDQKRPSDDRSPLDSPEHTRRKIERKAASPAALSATKAKSTVAEAVSDIAETANKEAQDAVARAEHEHAQHTQTQAEIAKDLDNMLHARTEEEFEESAYIAAKAIKKELDKEENQDVLEKTLDPELAQEVRDIVDEAAAAAAAHDATNSDEAQGPVADSWESEEIVVIEEQAPVLVYNFPMKPWITINCMTQKKGEDSRPTFRDHVVLDIARLKKDFDQIDRNLASGSESYMTYAMSKVGGLRVIRQTDGEDARVFTRTDDRIFNVSVSFTPPDQQNVTPKEAIIGTGISGTVYWVQMKNGDKDHLEDHPEQHGFALPPITSQDGDAPGGVLKTRARASSEHPEFFAVGRGKNINVIWPAYIFANNLFSNERDRVVDTEKLFKQCSLKINTGKAGKDFTFSPDDTTVVSLDKSGRVKFWDVRDLVAPAEGCDPRNPVPASTNIEITEPILTLSSTPEGDKAWPTSVLLLDKYRPYTRHTALRYMIVGMKQNHTLQLWDLALRKPVQEFNLPHEKESDAVCSVMYHPQTGMIIVGHPTRNSIYFLHLSAPKYGLKNISQIEFIQRLAAEDPTIPQPESTAVISGMREYSFANRGILRSLDLLPYPQQNGSEGDEPTLFELYAMHSKGVACLFIKQSDLGWSTENKVLNPVNAQDARIVEIGKLIPPPSPQPEASQQQTAMLPIRLATRDSVKDLLQKTPSSQGQSTEKAAESVASTSKTVVQNGKDEDSPAPAAVEKSEKSEKRSRKKKTAAANAAAAAGAAAEREFLVAANATNGSSSSAPLAASKTVKAASAVRTPEAPSVVSSGLSAGDLEKFMSPWGDRISQRLDEHLRLAWENLFAQLQEQQSSQHKAFLTDQAGLLKMVSEVLNENTELVLKAVVKDQFEQAVVPVVRETVGTALSEQLGNKFNKDIGQRIQREVAGALPGAVGQAFQKSDATKVISDRVFQNLSSHVDEHLVKALNSHLNAQLLPALDNITSQAVQRLGEDIYRRIEDVEQQRRAESTKMDQLIAQTTSLSEMISTMAASQTLMQQEFLALKQQMQDRKVQAPAQAPVPLPLPLPAPAPAQPDAPHLPPAGLHGQSQNGAYYGAPNPVQHMAHGQHSHSRGSGASHSHSTREATDFHQAPASSTRSRHSQQSTFSPSARDQQRDQLSHAGQDPLVELIDSLMSAGKYDEAMMRFLQSADKEDEIFKQVVIKYDPNFITELQPLLLLSVGATISTNLDGPNVAEKVTLLEMIIYTFDRMVPNLDDQLRDVTPKIMGLLKGRIEQLYGRISRIAPTDPFLKTLSMLINVAGRISEAVRSSGGRSDNLY